MPVSANVLGARDGAGSQKVRFPAGDGAVVGNLYLPEDHAEGRRHPAIVVGGSLTSVKEQMGGIYAAELAQRGFVTLAIDYRHYGESSGEPRQYEDPATKREDLLAAAAFLAARPEVLAGQVSLLGVCTSGGNVLYAAAERTTGIHAVACVASHFAQPAVTNPQLYGGAEGVAMRRAAARDARAHYQRTGESRTILAYHDIDKTASHPGPMVYYLDAGRGGGVAAWKNQFAVMSWAPWLDFDPVSQASRVKTPTLVVHSDDCALPAQAREVYARLQGPKRLHWTTGAHFDFYDGPVKVREAADRVAAFFRSPTGEQGSAKVS